MLQGRSGSSGVRSSDEDVRESTARGYGRRRLRRDVSGRDKHTIASFFAKGML
jgi:hypothetical protein